MKSLNEIYSTGVQRYFPNLPPAPSLGKTCWGDGSLMVYALAARTPAGGGKNRFWYGPKVRLYDDISRARKAFLVPCALVDDQVVSFAVPMTAAQGVLHLAGRPVNHHSRSQQSHDHVFLQVDAGIWTLDVGDGVRIGLADFQEPPEQWATGPEFRTWLERSDLTQSGLARLMREMGDPRSQPTLLRSISNWATGATALPGEMHVLMRLLQARVNGKAEMTTPSRAALTIDQARIGLATTFGVKPDAVEITIRG
jgi:hypothetical protein